MNAEPNEASIQETELRLALQPLRPDRTSFAVGIQQRLESAASLSTKAEAGDPRTMLDGSDWLRIAAAIIPWPLLGKSGAVGIVKLGQLSFGKKILALAALPATGLLLMITATIWAIIKIRRAQQGQSPDAAHAQRQLEVTATWWRQFGALMCGILGILLLLMMTNHTLPVYLIFLVSGIAMVSFITRLGKEGLIERNTLAGTLGSGLGLLAQISQIAISFEPGYPLLDPLLIPAVLFLGGLIVFWMFDTSAYSSSEMSINKWLLTTLVLLLTGWFTTSLWYPITTRDMKRYVESFDYAEFSSASWNQWQIPAEWLRETGAAVDWSKPRTVLQAELNKDQPNHASLLAAVRAGLLERNELSRVTGLEHAQRRLFDELNRRAPLRTLSFDTDICLLIHILAGQNLLSESERDFVGERLRATWEDLKTNRNHPMLLTDMLQVTRLAELIGQPLDIDAQRPFVHDTLVRHQCLKRRLGSTPGGFNRSNQLNHSDPDDTCTAIELMQIYGIPADVNIQALRSFLRASANERWFKMRAAPSVRLASRQRLESLPNVPPVRWLDYLWYEQGLMMATIFSLVCMLAIRGAPKQGRA